MIASEQAPFLAALAFASTLNIPGVTVPTTAAALCGQLITRKPLVRVEGATVSRSGVKPTGRELAEQLTRMDAEWFSQVTAEELLDNGWQRANRITVSPNVSRLVDQFGEVYRWCVSQLVCPRNVEFILEVMDRLLALNNFNGLMAILTAIFSPCAERQRLHRMSHWNLVRSRCSAVLDLMSPHHNYARYVARLSDLEGRPIVPWIAWHLRDLQTHNWSRDVRTGPAALAFGWRVGRMLRFQAWTGLYEGTLPPPWREARTLLSSLEAEPPEVIRLASWGMSDDWEDEDDDSWEMFDNSDSKYERRRIPNPIYGRSKKLLTHRHHGAAEAAFLLARAEDYAQAVLSVMELNGSGQLSLSSSRNSARLSGRSNSVTSVRARGGRGSVSWEVLRASGEFQAFHQQCATRQLALPESIEAVIYAAHGPRALRMVASFWKWFGARGKNTPITVTDAAPGLRAHVFSPPIEFSEWRDRVDRPIVLMRANLWVEGDLTQPTQAQLEDTLVWIGHMLAERRCEAFTFVLDASGWRETFNQNKRLYAFVAYALRNLMIARCEMFLLLDASPAFERHFQESTQQCPVPASRMRTCTRADLHSHYVEKHALPPDFGGTQPRPDVRAFVERIKRDELEWHYLVPGPADWDKHPVSGSDDEDSNEGVAVEVDSERSLRSSGSSPANSSSKGRGIFSSLQSLRKKK